MLARMDHNTHPRKSVPNLSADHQPTRTPSDDSSDAAVTALGCIIMLLPVGISLLMMYGTYKNGEPWGSVLLSGAITFIVAFGVLIWLIFGTGSGGSTTSSTRVVQDIPLHTKATMESHPDMTTAEAAQHIVPPPVDPRHARVATVRMPNGRVAVIACNPRGGPPPQHATPNTQITKGEPRHG